MRKNKQYSKRVTIQANDYFMEEFRENKDFDDVDFRNLQIFNLDPLNLEVYLNGNTKNFKFLPQNKFITLEDYNLKKFKIFNPNSQPVEVIITADNDFTELECLKKIARLD
jgi:hypothetical protein